MSRRSIGSDLAKVDAHVIQPEEYDEAPELDDAFFDKAVYEIGSVQVDEAQFRAAARAAAAQTADWKVLTRLTLDLAVLEHFQALGPDWEARINAVLRAAMQAEVAKKALQPAG